MRTKQEEDFRFQWIKDALWFTRGQYYGTPGEPDLTLIASRLWLHAHHKVLTQYQASRFLLFSCFLLIREISEEKAFKLAKVYPATMYWIFFENSLKCKNRNWISRVGKRRAR